MPATTRKRPQAQRDTAGTAPPSSPRRYPTRSQTSSNNQQQQQQQQSPSKQTASGRNQQPRAITEDDELESNDESEERNRGTGRGDGDSTSRSASPVFISTAWKSATAKGKETVRPRSQVVDSSSGSESDREVANLLTPAKAAAKRIPAKKLQAAAASRSKAIASHIITEEDEEEDEGEYEEDQLNEEIDELESDSESDGDEKPVLVRSRPLPTRKQQLHRDGSESDSEEERDGITLFSRRRNGKRCPDRIWVYGEFYTQEERVEVIELLEVSDSNICEWGASTQDPFPHILGWRSRNCV